MHQFIAHAATREVATRVGRTLQLRIQNSHCRRQGIVGHMVVADNEVDTAALGILYLVDGFDATVEDDYQLHPIVGGIIDYLARYAIALVVACWNVKVNLRIKILQIPVHQGNCCGAIYIVVAIHQDFFFRAHCAVDAVHRLVHVGHQEGVVEVTQRRVKEFLGLFDRRDATLHEQLRHRRTIGVASCQFAL